jgi:hypothetical protein
MPLKIDLPGGWAELADIKTLAPGHQDDYMDLREEIRGRKEEAALAAAAAVNPAAMPDPNAPPPSVRLTRRDIKPVHDLVCGWVIKDISFPGVLPWDPGSRDRLGAVAGLSAWNALLLALDPYFGVLNGEVGPKESATSITTSGNTSPESAPAPPADSVPELSAMPAGSPRAGFTP